MRIDNQTYYPASLIGEVLSQRVLTLVNGRDGRDLDPALVAALSELSGLARDLDLPSATQFETLANVAATSARKATAAI